MRSRQEPAFLATVGHDHDNLTGCLNHHYGSVAGAWLSRPDLNPNFLSDRQIQTALSLHQLKPEHLSDGSFQFDGATPIAEAASILERPPMAEGSDYGTIAGFVFWQLGHIPEANEAFEWEGWRFVITALEGHWINAITTHLSAEEA